MKLTYDKENNVAYLALVEIKPGSVHMTVAPDLEQGGPLNFDVAEDGSILGIEFLDPETQLRALREIGANPGKFSPYDDI